MIESGKPLEEIIVSASQLTSKYNKIYYDHTSIKPEDFITLIYQSITK